MSELTYNNESAFYALLGERIRSARRSKRLDQEHFAISIGLTRTSVINIEKGRQRPSVYQICMMAQILDVQLIDLIPSIILPHSANLENWENVIDQNDQVKDESHKKVIMDFISYSLATR